MDKTVGIIDTTLRDAHQCLWATRMTTAHMLPIAEKMDQAGFDQIDLAGTIQFDVCVRYLKEDPWERVRLMRETKLSKNRFQGECGKVSRRIAGGAKVGFYNAPVRCGLE